MTVEDIKKKTTEQIRKEVIEKYDFDEELDVERIDKLVEERKNNYSTIKQKVEQRNGKEHYKNLAIKGGLLDEKTGKPKVNPEGNKQPNGKISLEDKAYLFSSGRVQNRTEMRNLEKVMALSGKKWEDAIMDNLHTTFVKENDKLITRRGSGLPASRGGRGYAESTDQKGMVKKFSEKYPLKKGFSAEKPKT